MAGALRMLAIPQDATNNNIVIPPEDVPEDIPEVGETV
jgi:cell division protein FtsI (penicillin-binding protein 3)